MTTALVVSPSAQGHLRRLDMRRDLARVADLVELCFYDTLDPEGKQYLNEMRKAAQNAPLLGWASSLIDEAPMPPSGYVWEEDGRLVGNLSLIPIVVSGKRSYMIANVATHPDYRGRGIAKMLTITALDHAFQNGAASVWLQVRDDNPSAIHIYETTGFIEKLRRTSWYSGPEYQDIPLPAGIAVNKRHPDHWEMQREWLTRLYPRELSWHIPFDWNLFRPDVWGKLYRLINLEAIRHWSVEMVGELRGVLTWRHSTGHTDSLWMAVPEQVDEQASLALLSRARKKIGREQPLSMNYPGGLANDILRRAGFYPHQTLIWMEKSLARTEAHSVGLS